MAETKGKKRKDRVRERKKNKEEIRKRNGLKSTECKQKRIMPKRPYLRRGRRLKNGQCKTCGEFFPKKTRRITKTEKMSNGKDKWTEEVEYTQIYIECNLHGETEIGLRYGWETPWELE